MSEERVLERLVAWGDAQPVIRAMVLTGSRAGPGEWVDVLSDYDAYPQDVEDRVAAQLSAVRRLPRRG